MQLALGGDAPGSGGGDGGDGGSYLQLHGYDGQSLQVGGGGGGAVGRIRINQGISGPIGAGASPPPTVGALRDLFAMP